MTGVATPELSAAVAHFYSAVVDDANEVGATPAGLLAVAAAADQAGDVPRQIRATETRLEGGDGVAVVHASTSGSTEEDLLFAADTGEGWLIVAGRFAGGATWLGDEPLTLMVIGSDARPGQNQEKLRSDSLHILTIAGDGTGGAVVGFPRDTLVDETISAAAAERVGLPQDRYPKTTKWTNIMAGRGPELIRAIAEEITGIPLEGHVLAGFAGFDGLIDHLGKVPIDLPQYVRCSVECDHDFRSGPQTLNADEALDLARARKGVPGGDLGRSFNQGLIVLAAMEMVQGLGPDMLPTLLPVLIENGFTDLATDQLVRFGAAAFLTDVAGMQNHVIRGRLGRWGKASVVFLDEAEAAAVSADIGADGLLDGTPAPEPPEDSPDG